MVATAGASVATIGHELLGTQTRLKRGVVQELGVVNQLLPAGDGMDIDLDDAWIGCHLQQFQTRVARWRVTFDDNFHPQLPRSGLNGNQQVKVVLDLLQRRHEHVDHTVLFTNCLGFGAIGAARITHLNTQRGAGDPVGGLLALRHTYKVGWFGLQAALRILGAAASWRGTGRRGVQRLPGTCSITRRLGHPGSMGIQDALELANGFCLRRRTCKIGRPPQA